MQSNAGKLLLVAAAVAAAVVLFLVLGDDDSEEPSQAPVRTIGEAETGKGKERDKGGEQAPEEAAQVPTIVVEGGQPVGGVQELEFTAGDQVRFEVDSDVAEEVHVHGYDVSQDVTPGKPIEFDFPADLEGVFEVELEESVVPIAELTVNPK
jgi:hypothetical protein